MSIELAQKLRRTSTAPERRFWRLLHPFRTNGYHFRKQVQIGDYYVDFACLHAGLIVEIDGDTHGDPTVRLNDETRDDYLRGRGFEVLRFANDDVMSNPDGVYTVVANVLSIRRTNRRATPPSPTLPARGRVPAGASGGTGATDSINTLPLAGRAEEGGATRSASPEAGEP